jgi:hypothetical protein
MTKLQVKCITMLGLLNEQNLNLIKKERKVWSITIIIQKV